MIPDEAGFKTGGWDMDKYRQHARDDEITGRNAKERTDRLIPAAAVEAAAAALWEEQTGKTLDCSASLEDTADTLTMARRILEAAAPLIQSAAWLEGRNAPPDKYAPNPYLKYIR